MGRRSTATDLIGLAGLATLGYQLMKGRGKKDVPVEDRVAEAKAEPDYGEDYAREVARAGRGQVGVGAVKPKAVRADNPKNPVAKTDEKPAATTKSPADAGAGRGSGEMQLADEIMRRERDKELGMSRGRRSPDPRDLELGMSRGRREPGPPRTTTSAPTTPARAFTREELIAQIPGGDARPGVLTTPANPVDSTELGRNASALMNFTGPGRLVTGLSLAAREAAVARAAQKAYNSRAAMRRAEEGMSADEAARFLRSKALSEADTTGGAIGFKKGGSTRKAVPAKKAAYAKGGAVKKETKPAAKGWGMARGGRAAKIY